MEKFAERFTRQNEEIFPTADTAFILAFSVIMLNTDLHNPNIKPEKRMTLASFIRNNRGIAADGGDLPEDFLTGIFKGIQANPFTLKEDDQARAKVNNNTSFDASFLFDSPSFFGANAEDRKREEFRKEREEMMLASEQLFKKRPGKKGVDKAAAAASSELTDSVSPADVVKPMFDVTWGPLIGTLSQILETSSDEDSVALCLLGFVYAVRIASHSGMSLARDTFINSLAKLTTLGSIKEMKHKNIESIRTLLSIAIIDGEYLGESWGPVLQCISQLGRLQLFASGVDSDDKFLTKTDSKELQVHDGGGFFRQPSKADVSDRQFYLLKIARYP
jgi:brefeldin A-inhibited guanine nucleotide-exchange protein